MNRYDGRVYYRIVKRDNRLARYAWMILLMVIVALAIALESLWWPKIIALLDAIK